MPWSNRHLAARAFLLCLSANPVKLKLARKTAPIGLWSWAAPLFIISHPPLVIEQCKAASSAPFRR
jgi:hypothetical protein